MPTPFLSSFDLETHYNPSILPLLQYSYPLFGVAYHILSWCGPDTARGRTRQHEILHIHGRFVITISTINHNHNHHMITLHYITSHRPHHTTTTRPHYYCSPLFQHSITLNSIISSHIPQCNEKSSKRHVRQRTQEREPERGRQRRPSREPSRRPYRGPEPGPEPRSRSTSTGREGTIR
jgi:hypothetical protein